MSKLEDLTPEQIRRMPRGTLLAMVAEERGWRSAILLHLSANAPAIVLLILALIALGLRELYVWVVAL